jgi:hypothetical protein
MKFSDVPQFSVVRRQRVESVDGKQSIGVVVLMVGPIWDGWLLICERRKTHNSLKQNR